MKTVIPIFFMMLVVSLSSCERDKLASFQYIKDFRLDTLVADTLAAGEELGSFYAYQENFFYFTEGPASEDSLHCLKAPAYNTGWTQGLRLASGLRFFNGKIQFVNQLGELTVLNASTGVLEESLAPVTGESFDHAFFLGDSLFNAFRNTDGFVAGFRKRSDWNSFTEILAIPDSEAMVEPHQLNLFEINSKPYAVWYAKNTAGVGKSFWVVAELTGNSRTWKFEMQGEPGSSEPIALLNNNVFYYAKDLNTVTAYHLSGDSLVWESGIVDAPPVAVNANYVYCQSPSSLKVLNHGTGNVVYSGGNPGTGYFYQDGFVLDITPAEFRLLDPANYSFLKSYPKEGLELISAGLGKGRFVMTDMPGDNYFKVIKITAK